MYLLTKTYSIVIPDSIEAQNGEPSDSGFEFEDMEFDTLEAMTNYIKNDAGCLASANNGNTFYTIDDEVDMHTFEHTQYGYHVDVTEDEYDLLCSLLCR